MDDASADRAARVIGRRRFLAVGAGVAAAAIPRRAPAKPPTRGGVLKHIGLEPATFDVHATAAHQTQLVSSFVRRSLFKFVNGARYGPSDFTIVPDLALRATVSSDGKASTTSTGGPPATAAMWRIRGSTCCWRPSAATPRRRPAGR